MSNDREVTLQKSIRRLTKRIGEALRQNDHNEAKNLRQQRGGFIKQLVEEFDLYYYIDADGKSAFGSLVEAQEHYDDPETKKRIAITEALTELFQGREYLRNRKTDLSAKTDADVKTQVLTEITDQMGRMEASLNELRKEVGKAPLDFGEIDASKDTDDLDGIDLSSLLD